VRKGTKSQLAFALAKGITVAKWARTHDVPKRTAYRWSKDPIVRRQVEACRRRAIDRAVGMMTDSFTWVVGRIKMLGEEAESESVQLKALRSILSDMISVSKFSGLEGRMNEIEEELIKRGKMVKK
jgi:hypothetical protein